MYRVIVVLSQTYFSIFSVVLISNYERIETLTSFEGGVGELQLGVK